MANYEAIDIQFTDVTYEVKDGIRGCKKQILKGLSGFFKTGELTAVMGPSGAGKSTLLNILSGFYQGKLGGKLEYIGNSGKKQNWQMYKKQSCYIQQIDSLYDLFTTKETMMMAAHMKIDNNSLNNNSREIIIDNVLVTLNLLQAKNTRVNRLSGGERKRLSIALELLSSPQIMFLDEPITGLDSLASFQCVNILRTLSKAGRTVICTIHQPSSIIYQLFDYVYVIADGQCMYAGTPINTVNYFAEQGFECPKSYNPADYMIEIISREYGNHDKRLIVEAKQYCCRDNANSMKIEGILINKKREMIISPSELNKFWILLRRCGILLYRDWTMSQLRLIVHFLMAVLLGLLFENAGSDGSKTLNNMGYMFVNLAYLIYTSMIPAVLKFPSELAILKKERFNNWYQLRTYYIAMLVSSMPLQAFSTFVYASVSYWISDQPLEWSRFLMYLLVTILTTVIAEGTGMGLGTILNPINGTFLGAISLSAMLATSGFLIFFSHMTTTLYYISYLNYLRYSFDGILHSLYGNNREKLDCRNQDYCHYRVPTTLLEEMNMSRQRLTFWMDVFILFIHVVAVRVIVYLMLKRRLSKIC